MIRGFAWGPTTFGAEFRADPDRIGLNCSPPAWVFTAGRRRAPRVDPVFPVKKVAEEFPIQVVCAWIGNSAAVVRKHYLQVTEEHFRKATQNPTRTVHDRGVCDGQGAQETLPMSDEDAGVKAGQLLTVGKVAKEGFEVAVSFRGKTYILGFAGDSRGIIRAEQP